MSDWNSGSKISSPLTFGIGIGVALGSNMGVVFEHEILGMVGGLVLGLLFGVSLKKKHNGINRESAGVKS